MCSSDGRPASPTTACCFCVWWEWDLPSCRRLWGTPLVTWYHHVMTLTRKRIIMFLQSNTIPSVHLNFCMVNLWSEVTRMWHLPGWSGQSAALLHFLKEISSWRGMRLWPGVAHACYWVPGNQDKTQLYWNSTYLEWNCGAAVAVQSRKECKYKQNKKDIRVEIISKVQIDTISKYNR